MTDSRAPLRYPVAPRDDSITGPLDSRDPFRPLEEADAPATKAWVEAQRALTESWLAKSPRRAALAQRLGEIVDYGRKSPPTRRGGRYFQFVNAGREDQDRLVWTDKLGGPEHTLLDPKELDPAGTTAVLEAQPSPDGKHLAYMISHAGSDWAEIRVRRIEPRVDLPDVVRWVKFSEIAWTHDGRGFYYSRYDEPQPDKALEAVNRFQKLYLHTLGDAQADDALVYERPDDGTVGMHGKVTDDGRYLVITGWRGATPMQTAHVMDLATEQPVAVPVVGEFKAALAFVGNDGARLYFKSTIGAPKGKLVAYSAMGGEASETVVIPEGASTLEQVYMLDGAFVALYLGDAASVLKIHDRAGRYLRDIALPGAGAVTAPTPLAGEREFCFQYESFATPPTIYRAEAPSAKTTCIHEPETKFACDGYETHRFMVPSADGTLLPVFVSHRKGLKKDGSHPALLYGYGGFNLPVLPWFRTSRIAWMELGGIYVSACLRGGGEYGEEWYRAGTRERKQNVFDDFMAVSAWLVKEGYTQPAKLAINGGSNGGLLVGACLTQRPELYGAVVAAVGVFDMLRFHKFTIGWGWRPDYGDPDVDADAAVLLKYSPLHNLKKGERYPATLLVTGDHDDRVVPAHSYKFAAALQEAQGSDEPILLRVETNTGHGFGKPTAKLTAETADIYAFLCDALKIS